MEFIETILKQIWSFFSLEAPYADVIRTTICMLMGVPPAMLFVIMFIDGTWGSFIHIGESMMKDARLGFMGKFILTPSHHRVHYAKNVEYMVMNYCNLQNIRDKVFKTYQPEMEGIIKQLEPLEKQLNCKISNDY